MLGRTHLIGGAIAGMIIVATVKPQPAECVAVMTSALAGSIMPDIDHSDSLISRKTPLLGIVSRIVSAPRWGKHRRFWHSLWAAGLFGAVCAVIAAIVCTGLHTESMRIPLLIGAGMTFGAVWHELFDMCTKGGVRLLYPIGKTVSLMPIRTGTPQEFLFRIAAAAAAAGLAWFVIALY